MNSKLILLGAVGLSLTAGLLTACHDDHDNASTPPTPAPTSVSDNTAEVLVLARQTSETSSPIVVNGGAFIINDSSESSAPIAVNAM